ncbi:MAG: hypothetical protein DRJ31_08465 [Candidatus Methanomethylicota archaeon]|uniref:Uncharacterized protein n=1 Tax=Thermoproteota archaeon TaxID=2056631 RepID=A0A497ELI5_9CREN|nr:MAG: hypothetical protein DRJ31_08465 [Candidatus Verstraetearchaeota archaeon]
MRIKERLRELLKTERKGENIVKCDILRVLLIFNGVLWFSELLQDLRGFYSTLGIKGELKRKSILDEIQELEDMGLVKTDERYKAVMTCDRGVKDIMIYLVEIDEALNAFRGDEKILNYVKKRSEILRKYFEPKR